MGGRGHRAYDQDRFGSHHNHNPAARDITYAELVEAYYEQAKGLIEGVDLLIVETIFDTLNSKAAFFAIEKLMEDLGFSIPVMASVTFIQAGSDRGMTGRQWRLSGIPFLMSRFSAWE